MGDLGKISTHNLGGELRPWPSVLCSILLNPRHRQKSSSQPAEVRGEEQSRQEQKHLQLSGHLGPSHCNGGHPRPCWHGNGLARSDLEFNPTYDTRRRSALTQQSEIPPGACWLLPTLLSYPGSVKRHPANIFLPEPWAAGSPWTLISKHRGREVGVTAFSLPTSCLPPFLSNHWHQNLTCSLGWGVMAMARQVLSNRTSGWGLRYWAHGLCISHTHTYIHTHVHTDPESSPKAQSPRNELCTRVLGLPLLWTSCFCAFESSLCFVLSVYAQQVGNWKNPSSS